MSYWAHLDDNNNVVNTSIGGESLDGGLQWLIDNIGGRFVETWVEPQYAKNPRKNYASIGTTYDSVRDAFIGPKPDDSIGFDEETCQWIVPIKIL